MTARSKSPSISPLITHAQFTSSNVRSQSDEDINSEVAAMLTDGVTQSDVLNSMFDRGAPSELKERVAQNGYDFERAMTWTCGPLNSLARKSVPQIDISCDTDAGKLG